MTRIAVAIAPMPIQLLGKRSCLIFRLAFDGLAVNKRLASFTVYRANCAFSLSISARAKSSSVDLLY